MARADRIVFLVLACAAWAYVIARAFLVPVAHDEAGAFHMFVLTGDFVPFVTGWNAGNHLTQDALAQVSYFLFGESLIGLRMWSVLSFLLYAWYLWRCGPWFRSAFVRRCMWAALLCVAFMIEFFSLARGYGLAMAFWSMTIFHAARYMQERAYRDLLFALLGLALSLWSLLSMLMVLAGVLAVLGAFVLRDGALRQAPRRLVPVVLLGVVPWAAAVLFALGLKENGALYAGTGAGYFQGTLASVAGHVMDSWNAPWTLVLAVLTLCATGWWAARAAGPETRGTTIAAVLLLTVLFVDAFGQTLSSILLGSRLPTDRAALYLVQPIVMLVALSVDMIGARWSWTRVLAAGLLLLPLREARRANVDFAASWPDQAIPAEFYRIVAERQKRTDRPLIVGAQEFRAKSTWAFGSHAHGLRLNALDQFEFPQPVCDLLMIDTTGDPAPAGFRTIAKGGGGRIDLMERTEPLRTRILLDSVFSSPMSSDEFRTFWRADARPYRGMDLILEISSGIRSERGTINSIVYAYVEEEDGHKPYDRHVQVDHFRGSSHDAEFTLAEHLPRLGTRAARIEFGLYNPTYRTFSLDSARLRVREVLH